MTKEVHWQNPFPSFHPRYALLELFRRLQNIDFQDLELLLGTEGTEHTVLCVLT